MHVCLLAPFLSEAIAPLFDAATSGDLRLTPGMGGHPVVSLALARIARGYPTDIITLDPLARTVKTYETRGLRYTICPRRIHGAVRSFYNKERQLLRQALTASHADVLHAHWTYEYAVAARGDTRPTLITVHDHAGRMLRRLGPMYLPNYLLTRWVFRKAQRFTAVSPYIAGYVGKRTGAVVPVVPNPLPPELSQERVPSRPVLEGSSFEVITAASGAAFKNVRRALLAFAQVARDVSAARYHLAGPGLEADGPTACWSHTRGVAERVVFHGPLAHAKLLRLMGQCDVVLHSSLEESFAMPLIEGLALGKVVIAGRGSGGCKWVLDDGRAGVLTNVRSVATLAEALADVAQRRASFRDLAQRGREWALQRYDPDTILDQYEAMYAQSLSGAEPKSAIPAERD